MVGGLKFWHPLKYDAFEIFFFFPILTWGKKCCTCYASKKCQVTFLHYNFFGKEKVGMMLISFAESLILNFTCPVTHGSVLN